MRLDRTKGHADTGFFNPIKQKQIVKPKSVPCPICKVGVGEFCVTVGNTGWSHDTRPGEPGRLMNTTHDRRRRMAIRKMNEERES